MAYAPLVNGIHRLQIATAKPPLSALGDLSAIAADWSKDCSMIAAVTPSSVPEARCDSAAIEPSSSEDRSPIAAFSDFEASLSEAYVKIYAFPALVRGEQDPSDLGAPDAPEQDISSEEGLLDEEDYDDDDDVKKPSLLVATEALVLPGMIYEQDRCADHCYDKGPFLLEATEVLDLPGTTIDEKPSRLDAAEALALPGLVYEHDHCADRCIRKTSTGGQLIRSSGSNQLQSGLTHSVGQIVTIRKPTMVAIPPTNRKSTTVAFIQQLAATCTSYHDNTIAPFDPDGVTSQDLRKPALRQRPLQLLGSEDINGHWDKEGLSQATAGGGGMAKELEIAAIAVSYSMAMAMAGRFSYGYSTLEQCTPYGGATPRKPFLFGGT
ncbi:MAG: hypothetical protein M1836_003940 [Candelina mexicana]|nr:MAG: hypothetical protein M1836_003940 [Candelina mexicana]